MFFAPCYLGSKGLQHAKEIGLAKGKASWELRMLEKANFGQSFLLFFDGPAKNQQAYVNENAQKHFGSVFGQHAKIYKKNLSNYWL